MPALVIGDGVGVSPPDLVRVAQLSDALDAARRRVTEARARRDAAIVVASRAGASRRAVAVAAGVSVAIVQRVVDAGRAA